MSIDLKKVSVIFMTALIFALLAYLFVSFSGVGAKNESSRTQEVTEILQKAAAQCYALEGEYPQSLDYLQSKYGIILDYDRYNYYYDTGGFTNLPPGIQVFPKQ